MPARLTTALATTVAMISRRAAGARRCGHRTRLAQRASGSSRAGRARRYGVVGHVGRDELALEVELGEREQHRELRRGETATGARAAPAVPWRRAALRASRSRMPARSSRSIWRAWTPSELGAPRPTAISSAFVCASLSASTSAATSSVSRASSASRSDVGEQPARDRLAQQDLDVHLVVGAVDAGRVVDGVGVHPTARERVLDTRAACVRPRLPPSATTVHRSWSASMRTRVVGPVADVGVRLGARLHERADPAVPEQVDGGAQDGRDDLRRGSRRRRRRRRAPLVPLARACSDFAWRGYTPPPGEMSAGS